MFMGYDMGDDKWKLQISTLKFMKIDNWQEI